MKSVIFDHKSIKMDWGRNRPHPCAKGEFFVVTKIKILELSFIFKNNVYHERIKVKNNNDPRLIFAWITAEFRTPGVGNDPSVHPWVKDLQVLDPKSELFLDSELLESLGKKYSNIYQDMKIEILKCQGLTAKNLCNSTHSESLNSIHDLVKTIMALPDAFDKLLQLIRIAVTLPVTSASTERFFPLWKEWKHICVKQWVVTDSLICW